MDYAVEVLSRDTVYSGFFRMRRYRLTHSLFKGGRSQEVTREVLDCGQAVAVLLYDPVQDVVVLAEQFRVGALAAQATAWVIETVAGKVAPGESLEDVAHREVAEEAGCVCTQLIPISTFLPSPGGSSESIALFCGLIDAAGVSGIHGLASEHEDIRLLPMKRSDALLLLESSAQPISAPCLIALQWLALKGKQARQLGR